jgi:hypothetical protein
MRHLFLISLKLALLALRSQGHDAMCLDVNVVFGAEPEGSLDAVVVCELYLANLVIIGWLRLDGDCLAEEICEDGFSIFVVVEG